MDEPDREYFAELGSLGGSIRAARMTPEERSESARLAARTRWDRFRKNQLDHQETMRYGLTHLSDKECSMASMPSKGSNYLSRRHERLVEDWLMKNQEYLKGKTREQIADACSRAVAFSVSTSNIRSAAKAVGVELPRTRSGNRIGPFSITLERLDIVVQAVIDLYERVGEPVPQDLKGLHDRKVERETTPK